MNCLLWSTNCFDCWATNNGKYVRGQCTAHNAHNYDDDDDGEQVFPSIGFIFRILLLRAPNTFNLCSAAWHKLYFCTDFRWKRLIEPRAGKVETKNDFTDSHKNGIKMQTMHMSLQFIHKWFAIHRNEWFHYHLSVSGLLRLMLNIVRLLHFIWSASH